MDPIIIAVVGACSRSFGPETVRDVLLSETLAQHPVKLVSWISQLTNCPTSVDTQNRLPKSSGAIARSARPRTQAARASPDRTCW